MRTDNKAALDEYAIPMLEQMIPLSRKFGADS
jgi:hypothetical protein